MRWTFRARRTCSHSRPVRSCSRHCRSCGVRPPPRSWRRRSACTSTASGATSNGCRRAGWWSGAAPVTAVAGPATSGRSPPARDPAVRRPRDTPTSPAGSRARSRPGPARLRQVEQTGREVGRELAPDGDDDLAEAFRQTFTALGFQPVGRGRQPGADHLRALQLPVPRFGPREPGGDLHASPRHHRRRPRAPRPGGALDEVRASRPRPRRMQGRDQPQRGRRQARRGEPCITVAYQSRLHIYWTASCS